MKKKIVALIASVGIILAVASPANAWYRGGWGGYYGGYGYGGGAAIAGLAVGALAGAAIAGAYGGYGYGGYGYGYPAYGYPAYGYYPQPVPVVRYRRVVPVYDYDYYGW